MLSNISPPPCVAAWPAAFLLSGEVKISQLRSVCTAGRALKDHLDAAFGELAPQESEWRQVKRLGGTDDYKKAEKLDAKACESFYFEE